MQHPAPVPKPMSPHEQATPMEHGAQNHCFGCGLENEKGLQLAFYLEEDSSVVCFTQVPRIYEGPPQCVHGGIIATLLDEAMSKAVRTLRVPAMTRRMEIEYRRPVSTGTPLRLEGRLVENDGRKHWTEARILDGAGHVLAEGKGLFVEVRASRMGIARSDSGAAPAQGYATTSE